MLSAAGLFISHLIDIYWQAAVGSFISVSEHMYMLRSNIMKYTFSHDTHSHMTYNCTMDSYNTDK